jgi:hypothetical protein
MTKKLLDWPEMGVLLICVLIIFGAFLFVNQFGVNVPFWDDWDVQVSLYLTGDFANLRLDRLTEMGNQHRYFTPRIILGLLDLVDPLNTVKYLYAFVLIGVLTLIFLYLIYRHHADSPYFYIIGLPFAVLFFGVVLWDSWTHSAMMPGFSTILSSVIALWAVTSLLPGWRSLLIAVIAGSAAALANTPGNILLIGLAPLMGLMKWRNPRHYLVWGVVTAAITIWYLIDLFQPIGNLQEIQRVSFFEYVQFTLLFIISPVKPVMGFPENYGFLTGLSLLSLVGFSLIAWLNIRSIQDGFRKSIPWIGLSAWMVTTGAVIAIGRAGLSGGMADALSPRFQPYATMFWIGFAALLLIALTEPRRQGSQLLPAFPLLIAFIIGLMLVRANFYDLMYDLRPQYERLMTGYQCVRDIENASDDCLRLLYPDPDRLRRDVPTLAARGVSFLR